MKSRRQSLASRMRRLLSPALSFPQSSRGGAQSAYTVPLRAATLVALLALSLAMAWLPETTRAESCVTRELLDVAGYSFADTPVRVDGRDFVV